MKDELDHLFDTHRESLDMAETPANHQSRFMERLQQKEITRKPAKKWFRPLVIAASFLVLICLGVIGFSTLQKETSLATLSPEMLQTETFFKATITTELDKLKAYNDPELKEIITETLAEIDVLEAQYGELKEDLAQSGNDTRVIAAMISNFQDRIDLLEAVQETLIEITTLKQIENEITI